MKQIILVLIASMGTVWASGTSNNTEDEKELMERHNAKMHFDSNIEVTPEKKFEWTKKAAEKGDTESQYHLGLMYKTGDGVLQDDAQALEWYIKAAEKKHAGAMLQMGSYYYYSNEYEKGLHWLQQAAEQDVADANIFLGKMYKGGKGVKKDFDQALNYYLKANELDSIFSEYLISYINETGIMYYQGKDYEKAFEWFQKAADRGDGKAQYFLGDMYNKGKGVDQDSGKAFEWFQKAKKSSNEKNMDLEAFELMMKDLLEVQLVLLEKGKKGDREAQYILGKMYYDGDVVEQNYAKAIKWFEKAAEQDVADAQYHLGLIYQVGLGVDVDYKKAFKWFKKAAEQDVAGAQYQVANMYYTGQGVVKNIVRAAEWYFSAAENGHLGAQQKLKELKE